MTHLTSMFFKSEKDARPRVHGNGFVQAELVNGDKLHIWKSDCPRQTVSTLIHNHTSPFTSSIIIGKLRNEEYRLGNSHWMSFSRTPRYQKYQAVVRHDKDTELVKMHGTRYVILNTRVFHFAEGSSYDFPGGRELFHATFPESNLVVTRVQRYPEINKDDKPIVLVKDSEKPDNDFDRYQYEEYARSVYADVKKLIGQLYTDGKRISGVV